METISIKIYRDDVYDEVAKATDYTGSKLVDGDPGARERILATDNALADLSRFWDESVSACNENFKEMLREWHSGTAITPVAPANLQNEATQSDILTDSVILDKTRFYYSATLEVSKSFDKTLTASVQSAVQSYFIASITAQWFKFANKGEAADYFAQATEVLEAAERMLYSRKRPSIPKD